MIINNEQLGNVVDTILDMVSIDKQPAYILFEPRQMDVRISYSDGRSKYITRTVVANIDENEFRDKVIFELISFSRVVNACKASGNIMTPVIKIDFEENRVAKVRAEKHITKSKLIRDENGDIIKSEDSVEVMSVVSQTLTWFKFENNLRFAALYRTDFNMLLHFPQKLIDEKYPDTGIAVPKPISTEEWENESDTWRVSELRNILTSLAGESGKLVYISPKGKIGFVHNTSNVICIPFDEDNDIKNRIVQSTSNCKAIASILSKIEENGFIRVHTIGENGVVFSTEDNSSAFMYNNMTAERVNVAHFNNCRGRKFSKYLMNFNTEVMKSIISGAKQAGASDKAILEFRYADTLGNDEVIEGVLNKQLVMSLTVKNTNSSTLNKYDIKAVHYVDLDNDLDKFSIEVSIDNLYQAIDRIKEPNMAFDVDIEENRRMVRIAAINMDLRSRVSQAYNIRSGWEPDFEIEHKQDILGVTTYFAV